MNQNAGGFIGMKHTRSTWEEFDSLPREIRDAINYSVIKYSTRPMNALIRKHGVARVVQAMRKKDEDTVAKMREAAEADLFLKGLGL